MATSNFKIRPYTKKELAALYFPSTAQSSTQVANLRNLMQRNPALHEELKEALYKPRDKIFTPRQISIIIRYLGEP